MQLYASYYSGNLQEYSLQRLREEKKFLFLFQYHYLNVYLLTDQI